MSGPTEQRSSNKKPSLEIETDTSYGVDRLETMSSDSRSFDFISESERRSRKKYKSKNKRHRNWRNRHFIRLSKMSATDAYLTIEGHKDLCRCKVVPDTDVFNEIQNLVNRECADKPAQYLSSYKEYIIPSWDIEKNRFMNIWIPSYLMNDDSIEDQGWSYDRVTSKSTYDYIEDTYVDYVEEDHRSYIDHKEPVMSKLRNICDIFGEDEDNVDLGSAPFHGEKIIGTLAMCKNVFDIYGEWDDTVECQTGYEFMFNIFFNRMKNNKNTILDTMQTKALKLAESILTMYYSLTRAVSIKHFFAILTSYVSLMCKESVLETIVKYCKSIFNYNDSRVENQSAEYMYEVFKNIKTGWSQIQGSKLFGHITKALGLLVSFKILEGNELFNIRGFEQVYEAFRFSTRKMGFPDAITWCLEFSSFILDKGLSLWTGKSTSFMSFFYDEAKVLTFMHKITDLENAFDLIKIGQHWKADIDINDFRIDLEKMLFQMSNILNTMENASERAIVLAKLTTLKRIKNELVIMDNNKTIRISPYAMCIWGDSSVGKSALLPVIINAICRVNGICDKKESIISINSQDKYQSEIMPQHRTIIVDDAGNTNAMKAEGNHVDLGMKLINNNPIHAVKADLADKGKIVMHPDLVIFTANRQNMDVGAYSNHHFSFMRRFRSSINARVRPQYCKAGTNMLDPDKVTSAVGDYWLFDVTEAFSQGDGSFNFQPKKHEGKVLSNIGLDQLLKYLAVDTKAHFTHQHRIVRDASNIHEVPICPHGSYSTICTMCRVNINEPDVVHNDGVDRIVIDIDEIANQADNIPDDDIPEPWTLEDSPVNVEVPFAEEQESPEPVLEENTDDYGASYEEKQYFFEDFYNSMKDWSWWKFLIVNSLPQYMPIFMSNHTMLLVPHWWTIFMKHLGIQCLFWYAALTILLPIVPLCLWVFGLLVVPCSLLFATLEWGFAMAAIIKAVPLDIVKRVKVKAAQHKYKIAGMVAIVAVGYGLKKVYDSFSKIEEQGSEVSRPKPLPKEDGSIWASPELYPVTLNEKALTTTKDQLRSKLSNVQCHAVFRKFGESAQVCNITPISNGFWVAPWHVLVQDWSEIEVTRVFRYDENGNPLNNSNFKSKISMNIVKRVENTDLGVMYLPKGGSIINLSEYLPKKMDFSVNNFPTTSIYKDRDGKITIDEFNAVKCHFTVNGHDYQAFNYKMSKNTFGGLCGTVLQANWKHPFIAGFHTSGRVSNPEGWACILYHDDYLKTIRLLEDSSCIVVQSADFVEFNFANKSRSLEHIHKIHDKSPSRYLDNDSVVNHLGMHNGQRRTFRSNVCDTIITGTVSEVMGVENKYGPPAMSGWFPWQSTLQSWATTLELDPWYLDVAAQDFNERIFTFIDNDSEYVNIIYPIDDLTILSGVDGVRFVDRIKTKTSMGWPYCKPKHNYITPLSEYDRDDLLYEGITEPLVMTPELHEEVIRVEEQLAQGKRANFIFRSNLKDEPKKKGSKKVRVFSGAPFVCTFLMRRYFTMIFKYIQEHSDLFECAVGCNANGPDWTDIANRIKRFGEDRCIAGDYKTYDLRMANQVIFTVLKVFIKMAIKADFNERQITIMKGLCTELGFLLYEFNGEYLLVNGSNASGHQGTVFVNDMANSLYLRYSYYKIRDNIIRESLIDASKFYGKQMPNPGLDFSDHVSMVTYGDDNALSVHESCWWFTHTSISECLIKDGVTYTMADKEAESRPYIHFSEVSFLKRRFVWSEDLQNYAGPLDEDSIFKSLHCVVASKVISAEQQAAEVINNANREYFYYGREIHDMRRQQLTKIIELHNLQSCMTVYPLMTYDDILVDYTVKYLA